MDKTSRSPLKRVLSAKSFVAIAALLVIVFGVVVVRGMHNGTGVGGAIGDVGYRLLPFGKGRVLELSKQVETIKQTTVPMDQYNALKRSNDEMGRQMADLRQNSIPISSLPSALRGTPQQAMENIAKICGTGGEGVETSFFKVSETLRMHGSINTRLPAEQQKTKGLYEYLQRCLTGAGAYSGAVTGGQAETYEAVRQFQQACGLKVDGVIGNGTFSKIRERFDAVRSGSAQAPAQAVVQTPGSMVRPAMNSPVPVRAPGVATPLPSQTAGR